MRYENSQTASWLFAEVQKNAPLNWLDLDALLTLIDAPQNLHALFLALRNLPHILHKANAIICCEKELFTGIDLESAMQTCNKLLQLEGMLANCSFLIGLQREESQKSERDNDQKDVWQHLHGFLMTNPLYSCLCFRQKYPENRELYLQLQSQLLLASNIIVREGTNLSELSGYFLGARKLSEEKNLSLPSTIKSPFEYLTLILNAEAKEPIGLVRLILQQAYRGKKQREAITEDIAQERPIQRKIRRPSTEDYENDAVQWTGENFIPSGSMEKEEAESYSAVGGSPAEITGGKDEVPVPVPDEHSYKGPTLREIAFQAKQRSNHQALKNQLCQLAWSELNQFDIHILFRYLSAELDGVQQEADLSFLRNCLTLMFWLSAPLERVLQLQKFNSPPSDKSQEGLYLKNGRAIVARLHSPGASLKSLEKRALSKLAYSVERHINVPLPQFAHSESLLSEFRNLPGMQPHSHESDEERLDETARQIQSELSSLNSRFGTRLSLGRISNYLLHLLGTEKGEDLSAAMLFLGYFDKYSSARLHYTCAPATRMETAYRSICSDLLKELGRPSDFPEEALSNQNIYLGTPFCPRPESVRRLVKSLQQSLRQSRPIKKEFSSIKNFHYHYACYTACLIAFATTYRAVTDPSLFENDINFDSGLAVISDKDDKTFYHSRFVWIAEVCRRQIINYRKHLQRLYELFGLESHAIFDLFNSDGLHGRPLNLFLMSLHHESISDLRPSLLEEYLQIHHQYDLPANTNRHYLKMELTKSGCPPDIIEAFQGHWEVGQEPWNRFSNLSPLEFCRELDFHLPKILERDGWIDIEGYHL